MSQGHVAVVNSLLVSDKQKPARRYPLVGTEVVIGRDNSNFICLPDIKVSRRHCQIRADNGRFVLVDLRSSNGTYVNGKPVTECELKPGDRISVGATDIVFERESTHSETQNLNLGSTVSDIFSADKPKPNPELSGQLETLSDPNVAPIASRLEEESTYYDRATDGSEVGRRFIQVGNDLRFLYLASLATSRSIDCNQMLDELLQLIFDWIVADRGCVFLENEAGDSFDIKSFKCRADLGDLDFKVSKSIVNYVRDKKVGVLSSRAAQDRRWGAQPSILRLNIGEVMCVPIQGREKLLGLIYLDTLICPGEDEPPRFNQDSLKLLIAMAHQAAVAIENETYYQALLEKERLAAIGETTGVIAHHVKNVLQGINGGSHVVESGLGSGDINAIEKGWQIVAKNQDRISRLVSDMLLLGGKFEPNCQLADLNDAVGDVIEKLEPEFTQYSVACKFSRNPNMGPFNFDISGISSAVFHIINLSLLACRNAGPGQIVVQVGGRGGKAIIVITDNGMAIEISEPGEVLDPLGFGENKKIYGIGLAVSRKIISGHGGEISIAHPTGQGNRFLIELPLA